MSSRKSPSPAALATLYLFSATATAAETTPDAAAAMPQVTVVSERATEAYNPQQARGATRTDTPILEVPQSVRVITQQQLDDLGATRMADTVDFVSGIARLNDFGGTWDNYAIRGFSSTDMGFLVNGFPGARGYNPTRGTATVERFEFLKGPAGAVYGSSEPGGTINIVTKKPKFARHDVVEVSAGSSGLRRATLDSTGALARNVAYRLNVMAEEGNRRAAPLDNHRELVAPALTWVIDERTVLNWESEFLRVKTPLDRGLVNVRGALDLLPRDRVLNEPADGKMSLDSDTHQLTLEHTLTDTWRARAGASYKQSTFDGNYTEATSLAADNRTLNRQATWRQLPSRDVALQGELEGKFTAGGVAHTVLLGAEASRLWMNMEILRSANYPIDIYTPVYGKPAPALTTLTTSSDERQRVKAVFAQDQLSLNDQWKVLAGLRWDEYSQTMDNRVAKTYTTRKQSAVSPRAGLTYLPNAWSSLYVSAGKSFRGNNGTDIAGNAFDPQRSTSYEAGWKLQTRDQRLGATLAIYDITKTNVLTASDVPGYSVAAGEIRSTGFEADVNGQVDRHWRLTGNVAWMDARVTKDRTLAAGTRVANVPKVSAGVFALREDELPNGTRYGIGGGVNYAGDRSGNTADTYTLPAYTTVKLVSWWQVSKRARLSVDVHNLTNRMYYTASWGNLYVIPGPERSVVARLKIDL
ncbi:iron complex outermembrane receptor protein [Pseudoduganella flava]|uniref:Iron complex outermembrane receptor protein n=1 Tax=Pseudoduganella flava TaxID=871742 RepID=A0A562PSA5_9BURK|nr:TonB-dependent siderophore receptor [Pseudoduganella flava]QGZ39361.1 TonB-dependent siderophore receptor [Pseudoduganella flava]TWI47327.1 iron complex outermembrane receptor protein [Pseudoduganella flava]